ncbi:MAG: hypothetical protein ACOH5I_02270 [Oligoflexus sp.]
MKILFSEKSTEVIVDALTDAMGGRQLAKMVSFDVKNDQMVVTISKLGTSTLTFSRKETSDGSEFNLAQEKIALAHRPMKNEVKEKILKVVQKAGGKIATA